MQGRVFTLWTVSLLDEPNPNEGWVEEGLHACLPKPDLNIPPDPKNMPSVYLYTIVA